MSKDRTKLLEKSYVGTYKGSSELGRLIYARAYRMGCERAAEVVVMGDGAGWIKGLKEMHFPKAKFILDWWHLKEKVWETLRTVIPEKEKHREVGKNICNLLWRGEKGRALQVLKEMIASGTGGEGEEGAVKLQELMQYVENNQEGIHDYEELQKAGYYVGTGPVEKAGEAVIVKRQKKQGMKWSREGAEAVIQLRLKRLNEEWESYWGERISLN